MQKTRMLWDAPRPLRGLTLRTGQGELFTEADFLGRWTVVFVGYTRCPDVCPATLHALAPVLEERPDLHARFLSVDPEHEGDLAAYVAAFHPRLGGLTGTPAAITHATDQLGASFAPSPTTPGLVDHSTSLFLVDPVANVVGVVLRPTAPTRVQADLDALRAEAPPALQGELWTPPAPAGVPGVVYGSIHSPDGRPARVVGVQSPDVAQVALHETVQRGGTASMEPRPEVDVAPDLELRPGGLHLMLMGKVTSDAPRIDWTLADGRRALMKAVPRSR